MINPFRNLLGIDVSKFKEKFPEKVKYRRGIRRKIYLAKHRGGRPGVRPIYSKRFGRVYPVGK